MSFTISVTEHETSWILADTESAGKILELFERNPFGSFTGMDLDTSLKMKPYSREQILKELAKGEIAGINVGSENPVKSWGAIKQNQLFDGFFLEIEPKDISKVNLRYLKDYLRQWRKLFPKFSWADASADDRDNDFWLDVAKTEPLPDCFGSRLGWYHVIGQRGYESFFRREDLLNTPALNVEELNDGTICILNYADPLDYSKPETTKKIIEITNYLTEKWYEFDPLPTFDMIEQT